LTPLFPVLIFAFCSGKRCAYAHSNLTGAAAICPSCFGITPGYCELPARSSSEDRGRSRLFVSYPGG
jgi:hypothetical protein